MLPPWLKPVLLHSFKAGILSISRMFCDCRDGDLIFIRTITPKYPVSCRSGLFSICFENFFSFGAFQAGKFMSLKALMAGIFR